MICACSSTTATIWCASAQGWSRLRWHPHELFPGLEIPPKALRRQHVLAELEDCLAGVTGTVAARELLVRCRESTQRANELQVEITRIVRRLAPSLLTMPGCGELSAAKIVGEAAGAPAPDRRRPSPAGTGPRRSPCGPATARGIA